MMNYEIFKEVVKEKFMDYMPDNFKGMELVVMPVEKCGQRQEVISRYRRTGRSGRVL